MTERTERTEIVIRLEPNVLQKLFTEMVLIRAQSTKIQTSKFLNIKPIKLNEVPAMDTDPTHMVQRMRKERVLRASTGEGP